MWIFFVVSLLIAGCGQSYEEKQRVSRRQRLEQQRQDSAALKVAVMPTADCLPIYVAKERGLFERHGVDVRLRHFTAQMDCDTAIERGRVEGFVSDLVRTERLRQQGVALRYVASTDAYWQLITNRTARIRTLKQLDDKMVAMTRYSATDLLTSMAVDSAKLQSERVFRIQVNDVGVRLRMLLGNELDAMWLAEPQALLARQQKHRVLLDSRRLGVTAGVVAFREKVLSDSTRQRQLDAFLEGYREACDSLSRRGLATYRDIAVRYLGISGQQVDSLTRVLKFNKVTEPRQQDIDRAQQWLKKN